MPRRSTSLLMVVGGLFVLFGAVHCGGVAATPTCSSGCLSDGGPAPDGSATDGRSDGSATADAEASDAACPSCTSCPSVDATHYDAGCAVDSDCVVAYSGNFCSRCQCPNAAINRAGQTAYGQESAAALAATHYDAGVGGCACSSGVAKCVASICQYL